ncbi:hypothetical protein GGI42DRAFT_337452 [Trichoderma sp. SZMC 28013]
MQSSRIKRLLDATLEMLLTLLSAGSLLFSIAQCVSNFIYPRSGMYSVQYLSITSAMLSCAETDALPGRKPRSNGTNSSSRSGIKG